MDNNIEKEIQKEAIEELIRIKKERTAKIKSEHHQMKVKIAEAYLEKEMADRTSDSTRQSTAESNILSSEAEYQNGNREEEMGRLIKDIMYLNLKLSSFD